MIMQKSFDLGLKKIADAFEERAIKLYNKNDYNIIIYNLVCYYLVLS